MCLLVVCPVVYEVGRIQAEVEELNYLWDCHFPDFRVSSSCSLSVMTSNALSTGTLVKSAYYPADV